MIEVDDSRPVVHADADEDSEDGDGKGRASTSEAIETLALEIVEGDKYTSGDVLSLEKVMAKLEVSRAMAREVMQALGARGLITIQPRVGATIQPVSKWSALDPKVIEWRLATPSRSQMRSLTELREGVEPRAAASAATRFTSDLSRDLIVLSGQLKTLGEAERFDRDAFKAVDARFHGAVLAASNNELFQSLTGAVTASMDHRIDKQMADGVHALDPLAGATQRFPMRPEPVALSLHVAMAHAIDQSCPAAAAAFATALLAETKAAFDDDTVLRGLKGGLRSVDLPEADRKQLLTAVARAVARHGRTPMPIVVMGVAGCGKSTIGGKLAWELDALFQEGDDLHTEANRQKMNQGNSLTDEDRRPWLHALAQRIAAVGPRGRIVVTCSALKREYRDILRSANPDLLFLHLVIDEGAATARAAARTGHFMPASLIASQFATLEPLSPDENGLCLPAGRNPREIVAATLGLLGHP